MRHGKRSARPARRAFTLMELLTVIAIIAILAGLLLPVIAGVRRNGRRGTCMSNLHSLLQALAMYKDDWRVYPNALYGYAPVAPNAACSGSFSALPEQRLYPDYVKDEKAFHCPENPIRTDTRTVVDALNPMTGQPYVDPMPPNLKPCFYPWDSYDHQFVTTQNLTPANMASVPRQVRYNRKWTPTPPGIGDDPRQLVYKEPPDSTVVTWCLYHASLNAAGQPGRNEMALVAFLSGRVQSIPAERMVNWNTPGSYPWQVAPKP